MDVRKTLLASLAVAVGIGGGLATEAAADGEQFIPLLIYRTGPYAPNGIPIANGDERLLQPGQPARRRDQRRQAHLRGVRDRLQQRPRRRVLRAAERQTVRPARSVINPYSTGITYALIERASADKIPILSMGYGRTDGSDGRVFPYVFTVPMTYWSQASALIKYIGEQEGGMDNLKGKKLALVYHDSAYGKEPIPTLEKLAQTYGYELSLFPVAHPGLEQKSTWLKIGRQLRPDWTFMWGWGVMNSTAIKEAAAVGYPMDHFIGVWWSGLRARRRARGRGGQGLQECHLPRARHRLSGVRRHLQACLRQGPGRRRAREGRRGPVQSRRHQCR